MRTTRRALGFAGVAVLLALLAACSSKRVNEEPVIEQGDRVEVPDGDPRPEGSGVDRDSLADRRATIRARALEECERRECDAIVSGELRPGLTEAGVLAATGTTEDAWRIRRSGSAMVMTPRSLEHSPSDAVSEVMLVQLADGQVVRYAYREAQGVRLVDDTTDTTPEGRAEALAEMLLEQGDELAAAGHYDEALDRYDRADILDRDRPIISYRIAQVLEKQLRPLQALIQYRLFLHRLELEKLRARGEIAANIAEAVTRAQQRIIVLEKRTSGN